MESTKQLKGISVNILLLGVVSFLNDLASEMIIPILPLFITALGGGGLIVGLIGGLQDSIASVLKVFSGYWSDRLGKRKIFVTSGYLTSASFKLLLSFSRTWPHILIFASFNRVGKGLRTAPRDAIIADSMPEASGTGFGIHRAFDTCGAIFGGLAALLLYWFLDFEFNAIILIAAIIAFISLTPLYFVKEGKRDPQKISLQISLKKLSPPLVDFIMVATLFALANFTYMFFILKAEAAFMPLMPLKESIALAILLYVLFNSFYAGLAIPFGTLSDRIGKVRVLIFGYLLFACTCLGFAVFNSRLAFFMLFPFYGAVYALVEGNQRAFVCDLSTEEVRATALGTFHTMIGIMTLPSSVIAGYLWTLTPTHNLTFVFGSAVSLGAVLLFILLYGSFKGLGTFGSPYRVVSGNGFLIQNRQKVPQTRHNTLFFDRFN
ncbi:MAG: MFS transporter [Methanophagales archaeon ANME-1-THS]|nr:MAG: MFS transporter [Methanophagales archaeon ANME-1-THS]